MDIAKIGEDGLVIAQHQDITDYLVEGYKKIYGENINLKYNTQDGQRIAIFSLLMYDTALNILNIINGFRLDTAIGVQLDAFATFVNQKRFSWPKSIIVRIKSIRNITLEADYIYTFQDSKFSLETGTSIKEGSHEYVLYESNNPTDKNLVSLIPAEAIEVISDIIEKKIESDDEFRKRLKNNRNYVNSSTWIGLQNLLKSDPNVNDVVIYDNPENNTSEIGVPPKTIWIILDTSDFTGIATKIYDFILPNVKMKGNIEQVITEKNFKKSISFDIVKYIPLFAEIVIISANQQSASISLLNELKNALVQNLRFKIGIDVAISEFIDVLNATNRTFRYTQVDLYVYQNGNKVKAKVFADERYVLYNENIKFQVKGLES